ncbi:MAG: hypothetical protein MRY79_03855 [Alphaproteobacteria bacterium]|nr:hypothetical protein [Alphaproteobacteria bacterium]
MKGYLVMGIDYTACLEDELFLIRQLISEEYTLNEHQRAVLIDVLTEIISFGSYKIPKKRGGQQKKTNFKENIVAYYVYKQIQSNLGVENSLLKAAKLFAVSPQSAREFYYKHKADILDNLSRDEGLYRELYETCTRPFLNRYPFK